jgi:hypothetical protein
MTVWYAGWDATVASHPAYQTVIHKECQILGVELIVISPDDGHIVARNM